MDVFVWVFWLSMYFIFLRCVIFSLNRRSKNELLFSPHLYQVTGKVMDAEGNAHYILSGTWDEKIECSKVVQSSKGGTEGRQKTVYQTLPAKLLWKRRPLQ